MLPFTPAALNRFQDDYFAARDEFRRLARQAGWEHAAYPIATPSPQSEPLTIDVACWSPAAARGTLIVSSGLHGVEGPVGSAIQRTWLQQWSQQPPTQPWRLVFLHALNPHGFANLQRVNEDNVDLNRNFLPHAEDYTGRPPGYDQFHPLLNPVTPPARGEFFVLRGLAMILRYGLPALQQAIATGQHDYPQGLFYGGRGPCATTRLIRDQIGSWIAAEGPILHLDLHSGLGRWAGLQLLPDAPLTEARCQALEQTLGHPIRTPESALRTEVAYQATGGMGGNLTQRLTPRDYSYLCAEYGTHHPLFVLRSLRADQRLQYWTEGDRQRRPQQVAASIRQTKAQLREMFCPQSPRWRTRVLTSGCQLIDAAHDRLDCLS